MQIKVNYYWNNDNYSPESSSNKRCEWEKKAEMINSRPTNNRWAYLFTNIAAMITNDLAFIVKVSLLGR